jgi:hypothetical protein
MRIVAMLGTVAFVMVGALVGARVLRLALRTRKLPELCVGGSLFLYAAVAQPLIVASRPLGEAFGFEARFAAVALGLTAVVTTIVGLYAFTWLVFRPGSRPARRTVWGAGGFATLSGFAVLASLPETPGAVTIGMRVGIAGIAVVFGLGMSWAAWESLEYHARLRKRLALGLADPVVVNRFLLWGIGCGTTSLSSFSIIACVAAGMAVAVHPVPLLLTAVSGSVIAACWYLAFLPPEGYLRWIGDGAAQAADATAAG